METLGYKQHPMLLPFCGYKLLIALFVSYFQHKHRIPQVSRVKIAQILNTFARVHDATSAQQGNFFSFPTCLSITFEHNMCSSALGNGAFQPSQVNMQE